MASVTIAAQIAAFPICIYYFHQFPNMFLFTNLLVVPLSTVILFGEILLVIINAAVILAKPVAWLVSWLIYLMNKTILFFDGFSFSVADNIFADILTTWILYGFVGFVCLWFINRDKQLLRAGVCCLCIFSALHIYARVRLGRQKKILIYNVAKHKAVDFISAGKNVFEGDSALQAKGILQNFYLKPSRIAMQAAQNETELPSLKSIGIYRQFYDKRLLFIDSAVRFEPADSVIPVDILLLSHNARIRITSIASAVRPAIIVFDASNNLWKIENWKKECEELHLRFHSVAEEGAFVLEIQE
jgi:competence protein ComEC